MTPASDLFLRSQQSLSPEALRPAASTRGLGAEWFPATVTVTRISALPAWKTDSCPLGSGPRKAASLEGSRVAAWSLPEWGSLIHPATSPEARAAWPARLEQEALQTLRGAPRPSLSPRALAKDTPGGLPAADGCQLGAWSQLLDGRLKAGKSCGQASWTLPDLCSSHQCLGAESSAPT